MKKTAFVPSLLVRNKRYTFYLVVFVVVAMLLFFINSTDFDNHKFDAKLLRYTEDGSDQKPADNDKKQRSNVIPVSDNQMENILNEYTELEDLIQKQQQKSNMLNSIYNLDRTTNDEEKLVNSKKSKKCLSMPHNSGILLIFILSFKA
jgi:hypothetical protein